MTRVTQTRSTEHKAKKAQAGVESLARRPGPKPAEGFAIYQLEVTEVEIPVAVGDNVFEFEVPEDLDGAQLVKVDAYLCVAGSVVEVQIAKEGAPGGGAGSDMLTTKITIEAGNLNMKDAATQPEIDESESFVEWGDHVRVDVDAAGGGASGLGVILYFVPADTAAITLEGAQGAPGGVASWGGTWAGATTYVTSTAVSYGGTSYVSITNVPAGIEPGVTPGWEEYWQVLIQGHEFAALTLFDNNQGREMDIGVKGYLQFPFACELASHVLLADRIGDLVLDIRKDTYGNYPPTESDSICGANLPTLAAEAKSSDSTLSGWTTLIDEGDILYFVAESVATITSFSLTLKVRRL